MKPRIIVLLILFFSMASAHADTTAGAVKPCTWTLIRSATTLQTGYATEAACWAAGVAKFEVLNTGKTSTVTTQHRCRCDEIGNLVYTPPVKIPTNPFPNGETQTVQCTAPAVGNWTQSRTYSWSGSAWVAGSWTPATAPAGACTTPAVSMVTNWVTVATNEFKTFTTTGDVIRYGYGASWVSKRLASGTYQCDGSTFGNVDPAPGYYKECQIQISAPNVVQTGGMPVINTALMQPRRPSYSNDRIITSGVGYEAGPFDIGAFRLTCNFSHFAFDDPIAFPGQTGASHLHIFFGNAGVTANSTASSIASTGNSTCAGGTLNRTGYWVPAMVNMTNGAPIVPTSAIWYYKSAYLGVKAEDVKPFPAGLRMIAGSSANKTPLAAGGLIRFSCSSGSAYYGYIPSCPVGDTMDIGIQFPQCWDGANLDSPDHKSHMAYATGSGCPSTHPVALAEVSLNMHYTVVDVDPAQYWKLSSDNYVGQGGYSMHADWFDGWNTSIMTEWVTNCINKKASSTNALCDGRGLY